MKDALLKVKNGQGLAAHEAEDVARELAARKRSHYYVEDEYGKTLEE